MILRDNQKEIIKFLVNSHQIVGVNAPTGSGKTIGYLYYGIHYVTGKIYISTRTKALQNQVLQDMKTFFQSIPVTVVKGMGNYLCLDKMNNAKTDFLKEAPYKTEKLQVTSEYCRPDYKCNFKEECEYKKVLQNTKESKVVVLNHNLLPSWVDKIGEDDILIIDECHELDNALTQRIEITKEHFQKIENIKEPALLDRLVKSKQEFNSEVEKYLKLMKLKNFITSNNVKEPGTFEFKINLDYFHIGKIAFFSATFPEDKKNQVQDFYSVKDKRSWENIEIIIHNVNYKDGKYKKYLSNLIKEKQKKFDKVIILATNNDTLKEISSLGIHTTLNQKPFDLADGMNKGELSCIAGCSTMWSGISIPGKKCIIMTKLPFPNYDKNTDYEEQRSVMFTTLKQGIGRMLRVEGTCSGEIHIIDNRVSNYPEILGYLNTLQSLGASVSFPLPVPKEPKIVSFRKVS